MTRVADIADLERRAKAAFDAVVERTAEERASAIAQICGDDESLRARVRSLLAAHDHAENFLDPPPPLFGVAVDDVSAAALAAEVHASAGADKDAGADDTLLGKHIGRYRVLQKIASGGMGVVYLAEQEHPRRSVALKVIRSGIASRSLLRRFEHEAEVLGQLQHPGIAQVYEAGTFDLGHGGQPYFAMEYVRGRGLLDYCGTHELSVPQRLELLARICDAVHYAHQKGVIHRDLKPDNILVIDDSRLTMDDSRAGDSVAVVQQSQSPIANRQSVSPKSSTSASPARLTPISPSPPCRPTSARSSARCRT
jgi:predicted Ser/Thr protein kinase